MNLQQLTSLYDFTDKTVVITGGTGVLGREITRTLVECKANVALVARDVTRVEQLIKTLPKNGGTCAVFSGDVTKRESVLKAEEQIVKKFGNVDCLVNGAGGNNPQATTNPATSFFDLPEEALRMVTDLNLMGTILPSQVFGKTMATAKEGVILNVTSMAAVRPLTRIAAYSAAKAAVSNFTQWLAVHMAREYSPNIRVNAIAPGFFLTEQNRFLLTDAKTGDLTARGKSILDHTPAGRFGDPDDLLGAVLWLLSPASRFVTGLVLPIDGGFSAYSGV